MMPPLSLAGWRIPRVAYACLVRLDRAELIEFSKQDTDPWVWHSSIVMVTGVPSLRLALLKRKVYLRRQETALQFYRPLPVPAMTIAIGNPNDEDLDMLSLSNPTCRYPVRRWSCSARTCRAATSAPSALATATLARPPREPAPIA